MTEYSNFDVRNKYLRALLTEEEFLILETIRKYVDEKIIPKRSDIEGGWQKHEQLAIETIDELYAGLVELGIQRAAIPEANGGLGLSPLVRFCINEEIARGDLSFSSYVGKMHWLTGLVVASRNKTLIDMLIPKAISDDPWIAMVGFSEPEGGVNVEDITQEGKAFRMNAKLVGDQYLLNGRKIYASPGGPPGYFQREKLKGHIGCIFICTTDANRGWDGIGHFYVPIDTPGLSFGKPYEKMGCLYTDRNCDIYLDDVKIPKEYRLCAPGEDGNLYFGASMAGARLSQAARLTGVSQALVEIALNWTNERKIIGRPVREYSVFANIFGEILRDIEASRAHYTNVGWMFSRPTLYGPAWSKVVHGRCSAARSEASRCVTNAINKVMDLMGAMGFCYETKVEKFVRDVWIYKIGPGGAQRDLLDVALGHYPFNWTGEKEI